jgi:eukaryotic-like serine/threonine-protein kinase
VTASYDRTACIWDRKTGRPLSTPLRHRLGVSDAVFSPDGKTVLTGSWDGLAHLWKVPEPLKDEPERIVLWVEVLTGLSAEAGESSELLKADAWRERKAKLDALGGPPVR